MKDQQHYTDEALVQMIRGGNERDLDTATKYLLFRQLSQNEKLEYSGTVILTVRNFVTIGKGNEEQVKDVISESVIVFIRNICLGKFDGKSKLTTYLIGICKNKWLELRANWMKTDLQVDDRHFDAADSAGADFEFMHDESVAEMQKRNSLLRQLINQLREGCRKALTGYYLSGVKYEQLHKDLQLENVQQARKKVSECRGQLEAIIEKDENLKNFLKRTR